MIKKIKAISMIQREKWQLSKQVPMLGRWRNNQREESLLQDGAPPGVLVEVATLVFAPKSD